MCIGWVAATGTASPHLVRQDKSPHIPRGGDVRENSEERARVFPEPPRGPRSEPEQLDA